MISGVLVLSVAASVSGVVSSPDPYEKPRLSFVASAASHRPLDGIDYFGGDGAVSLGLRFSMPEGFYAAGQAVGGKGDGRITPDTSLLSIETAVGWFMHSGQHGFALELQDYRLRPSGYETISYQAAALQYRYREFSIEFGSDFDQPFYYQPLDRFFDYNTRRLAIAQDFPLQDTMSVGLSVGRKAVDRIDLRYTFYEARWQWRWREAYLTLAYSAATDDIEEFYPATTDRNALYLRISGNFSIF